MSLPTLPLFLQREKLTELNEDLFHKTGCFAFLKTDRVICATNPKSWQDAFSIFVMGLYSVYHDYGCGFLQMLMDDREEFGFLPPNIDRCSFGRAHTNKVETILRPNLAHGILHPGQRLQLANELNQHRLNSHTDGAIKRNSSWTSDLTELVDSMTEEHWMHAVEMLVENADSLYHYLEQWGESWAAYPQDLPDLKKRFAKDVRFRKSFDNRICRPIVKAALRSANRDIRQTNTYLKVDWNNPDPSSPLVRWQQGICDYFMKQNPSPDKIYPEFSRMIHQTIAPREAMTSVDLGKRYGFGP